MWCGLIGSKCGMTRVFKDGKAHAVTVIRIDPNVVSQVKDVNTDGYSAIQVGSANEGGSLKRVSMANRGHLAKAESGYLESLTEFVVDNSADYKVGQVLGMADVESTRYVDVFGVSKGKGFQGAIKRWGFRSQDATHGNSLSHRAPGSIGQCQTPGRVFKGKKMAGQLGNRRAAAQNLEVIEVRESDGLILVKGSVPGATGSKVILKPAVKRK